MAENIFSFIFTKSLDLSPCPFYIFTMFTDLSALQTALEIFCFLVIPTALVVLTITRTK
jgi:hypothetical protein